MRSTGTPPRIYITSVEDEVCGVVGRTEALASPAREQQERQDSTVTPIPSIDLAMALQERKRQSHGDVANGNDATGVIPLTGGVPASTTTTITMATVSSSSSPSSPSSSKWSASGLQRNWPIISQPLALLTIFALLWAIAAAILPPELSHPSGGLLRLLFLFVGAQTCGVLVALTGLPDMLGMLFWGVLYANVGWADFSGYGRVEVFLREMALVNIMLLAGLGLDYRALRSLFRFIMQLTVVPTVAEVMTVTILARYLLALPWLWGVLLGLVVTAISPNVVVTVLLRLKEERLGLNKGIHTLIIAVTSCNDVLAIFLFGVILGLIFTTGNLTSQILQGPIGIIIGLVYGTACGLAVLHLPSHQAKYSNGLRFTMTTLAGALSVVGSKAVGYPTAGALGCIVTAFVAGTGWRKRPPAMAATAATERDNEVSVYLDLLWKFLKPVSFSLIGKEVNFGVLTGETVLYGLITLAVAVLLRLTFAYLSTLGSELNWRERGYVTLSGFPKATVQAALGPAALDLARTLNATDQYDRAQTVLIVTVLAIILTAPLGALLMIKLAPRWLKQGDDDHDDDDHRYR
ncbi:sodium/hydrogen exchanger 9B2 isoform X2 [Anopheles darlingi]|uniref:sodium/hydrogen exchanger 9B2 isoform X2 n=1 Tax=Anopheles darlingi TaxID=43151 RepID=UPI002100389B|nr:sodium/hydrogen exchanger 9B2 isoform X2 [Anopheles darlingi]